MQRYIGTKIVEAIPLTRADAEHHLGRSVGGDRHGSGYLVKYQDGFQSWSPEDVFEEAYRPMGVIRLPDGTWKHGMSFGLAVEALKKGLNVTRKGWNGKGMYLFYVSDGQGSVRWTYTNGKNDNMALLPFIAMKTVDGKVVPWLASQTDILSDDWMVS